MFDDEKTSSIFFILLLLIIFSFPIIFKSALLILSRLDEIICLDAAARDDGSLSKNGFPIGKVGTKYKVHLPDQYSDTPGQPVDAEIVSIPFTESYNANTREVSGANE